MLLATVAAQLVAQPRDEDRRYKLGEGYERAGDLRGAARIYRELFDADPQAELYFQALRRTYGALGMHAELLPIVEARVTARPADYELRVTYADLLFRTGRRDEAREAWKRAVQDGNHQEFVSALVAQSQTDARAYELAIETYRAARERSDDRLLFADQLGYLYGTVGRYAEATREYLAILGADPERIAIVKRMIATFTSNPTGLATVTSEVEGAVQRNPDFEPTLELLSWLYDEAGNHAGALDVARKLDHARGAKGSSIYAYADRALREGRYDEALAALDHFLATYGADNPLHAIALLTYARALEEKQRAGSEGGAGRTDDLIERYVDLAERERGTPVAAEALLRAAELQANDLDAPDDAAATLHELIAVPNNASVLPDALLLLGDLRLRANDLDEARAYFDRAVDAALAIDDVEGRGDAARLRRAEILLYRGAHKEAVDSLTELTRHTASGVTNDALEYLFLMQETLDYDDAALKEYLAGRLAMVQHRFSEAAARLAQAATAAPGSTLAGEATLLRAEALDDGGDATEAASVLVQFVAANPDALAADRALFRAAEIFDHRLDDDHRALELYTRLLNEYPTSKHASDARARVRLMREQG